MYLIGIFSSAGNQIGFFCFIVYSYFKEYLRKLYHFLVPIGNYSPSLKIFNSRLLVTLTNNSSFFRLENVIAKSAVAVGNKNRKGSIRSLQKYSTYISSYKKLFTSPVCSPLQWRLKKIASHPGLDGVNRVATVHTTQSCLQSPLVKLCPLPKADDVS